MQVVHARCCGLDVHKKSVVACVLLTEPDGSVRRQVRTFGTMTADLLALDDWLTGHGVTQITMESTGVYWRPIFNLLEDEERTITLVNAQHLKAVPGHKTDVKDSEWLADLLRHGLVKASFIPPAPIRELRELTRARKTLVQQRADAVNRVHKLLEGANIKLASVASNILGKSGHALLDAMVAGETDLDLLAALAYGQLRKKRVELRRALDGRLAAHQRLLLAQLLAQIDFLTDQIAHLAAAIADRLTPMQGAVALLQTIPGVSVTATAAILAEIGTDMSRFPSAKHLASWAGLCPGNKQSGGKRLKEQTTSGNVWLKGILSECAWAAARTKETYLAAQFKRLARRRGIYKALIAVAHSLLVIIYHLLQRGEAYRELGGDYFAQIDSRRAEGYHIKRLTALGYQVTLTPLPDAEPISA
jgi:transposase